MTDTLSADGADRSAAPRDAEHRASSAGPAPQLVIFDLDGTLTDSAEGIVASFLHALSHVGAPVPEGDLAAQIVGPPMDDTFRGMELGGNADAAIAAFRAEYGSRGWAMNTLFDGIAPLLADLRAAGIRLAVATSKLEPTAQRILAHFGLDQHFEVIAGASADGSRKTKVEVLAHALDQLQPLPERVLMVGDAATTSTGRPHTASTPSWSAGATGRTTSPTDTPPPASRMPRPSMTFGGR